MSRGEAERELEELRERYRAKFVRELDSLEQCVGEAERAGADRDRLEAIRALSHRLMGTSGSYGLAESSAALGRIEARIDAALDRPDAATPSLWSELASDLAAARAGSDPARPPPGGGQRAIS